MPITAQLHNGVEMHFPDGTPDHEIDGAVQRHLATPDTSSMLPALISGFAQHLQQQKGERDAQVSQQVGMVNENRTIAGAQMRQADEHAQLKLGVMQGVAKGLFTSLQPLAEVAQNSQALPEVVRAINNLSQTIMEAMKAYISIASAPKELYHGGDGKPKGLRPVFGKNISEML